MGRYLIAVFGFVAYAAFLATFLYLVGFLAGAGGAAAFPALAALVPHTVDTGNPTGTPALALALDFVLLLAFALQHSIMARSGFKRWLTARAPRAVERSVYVLASSLCLAALYWLWRPLPALVWEFTAPWAVALLWGVFGAGVLLVLVATVLIDHLDLFGVKQVWRNLTGAPYKEPGFVAPWLYRFIRHPLYLGWMLMFWGAPVMSVGHLMFTLVMCVYVVIAIGFEERDLVRAHGERYVRYRAAVPMLLPAAGRRWQE